MTVRILAICVLVFFVQLTLRSFFSIDANNAFDRYLALSWEGITHGYIWQILTFQFMHGGILHILVNGLVIYAIGRPLEEDLGKKRFLQLYLISGVAGGLTQIIGAQIAPSWIADYPTVGASAGAFGLLAAFGIMYSYRRITVLLFFIIPITLSARALLFGVFGFTVVMFFLDRPGAGKDLVAHMAHLGGLLFGAFFTKRITAPDKSWSEVLGLQRWTQTQTSRWQDGNQSRVWRKNAEQTRYRRPASPAAEVEVEVETLSHTEYMSQKVDPILDKISRHGIQSLTDEERRILEKARDWMAGK